VLTLNISKPNHPSCTLHPLSTNYSYKALVKASDTQFYISFTQDSCPSKGEKTLKRRVLFTKGWSLQKGGWAIGENIQLPGWLKGAFIHEDKTFFLTSYFYATDETTGAIEKETPYGRLFLSRKEGDKAVLTDWLPLKKGGLGELVLTEGHLWLQGHERVKDEPDSEYALALRHFDLRSQKFSLKSRRNMKSDTVWLKLIGAKGHRLFFSAFGGYLVTSVKEERAEGTHYVPFSRAATSIFLHEDQVWVAGGLYGTRVLTPSNANVER